MESHDWNKIIGAILATLLFVMVIRTVTEFVYEAPMPAKPGFVVEGVQETSSGASSAPVAEALPDWGTVLPAADVKGGEQVAQRCAQCHDWSKGGPDKIGPNLWGVVGRARATHPGFSYSSAMLANHDPWTFDKLFVYLKSPASMVPGTKMSFAGLRSPQDRINLIAYLRTQSDSPLPIPAPAPKAPAAPAAAAPGKTPAAAAPGKTPTPAAPKKT
jgi:cytochrome c